MEISKRQNRSLILSPIAKVTAGMDKLELRFKAGNGAVDPNGIGIEGEIVLLKNMRGRDKAFNGVIGFSGVRWQNLQQRPGLKNVLLPTS